MIKESCAKKPVISKDSAKKFFYAGGFFYNPDEKAVFLHKRDTKTTNNPGQWAFFGGLSEERESPIQTFLREIKEELEIDVAPDAVHSLCDYFNPDFGTHRYVFFVINRLSKSRMTLREGEDFGWFPIKAALQLSLSKRTRQDLLTFLRRGTPSSH